MLDLFKTLHRRLPRRPGLTVLYVCALSSVAVLTCGGQWLIQKQLVNGEADSRVINIAGRQRMLSQRLAKAALRLDAESSQTRAELQQTLQLWTASNQQLQQGDPLQGLPGNNSPAVQRLFHQNDPHFRAMRSAALTLLDGAASTTMRQRAIDVIQQREGPFLEGMDAIVSQYVDEAERKVARLRSLEAGVLTLTLLVLVAEGVFIFRPAVRQIDRTLTRLNRTGRRLRAAKQRAEEADRAKSRFLASVSHELRTPMTAVLGMTELARGEHDDRKRDERLATVSQAGELLLGLLNDVIDFARVDSGNLGLEIRPFSPHQVLTQTVQMMRPACDDKGISLAPMPMIEEDLVVLGDPRRLEQVLLNLISNAVKWTKEGCIYVRCERLNAEGAVHRLRYSVQDTGVGISADHHQAVFEPFTQISTQGQQAPAGVGLGLAICRRIAEAMDAELQLSSQPGVGTTVSLTGDFCQAAWSQPAAAEQDAPASPMTVLVVEDTEVIQRVFQGFLADGRHNLTVVDSGEQAVRLAESVGFDVAFIDLQLTGIDGLATASQIRELTGPACPRLVCVTADARASLDDTQLSEAFESILIKPFTRTQILDELAAGQRSPTAALADAPHCDDDQLDDLQQELAQVYLTVAASQEDDLTAAVQEARWADARVVAHRLAGQVANFGELDLADKLRELEVACEGRHASLAEGLAGACVPRLAELRKSLATRLSRPVG